MTLNGFQEVHQPEEEVVGEVVGDKVEVLKEEVKTKVEHLFDNPDRR